MLKLVVTEQFRNDLARTHYTISHEPPYSNPDAARRLSRQVSATIEHIQEFPYISPISHSNNTHELRCRRIAKTNFRVVYTISNNEIIILSLIGKGYDLSGHSC